MATPPKRPGRNAGITSPRTLRARGPLPLTAEEREWARFLRFDAGWDWPDIAVEIGRSEQDIRHSLANARTRRADPPRGTVNVSPAAIEELRIRQLPGEPMWKTMNRILGI